MRITPLQAIEMKLNSGAFVFNAQEVATLLNIIRVKDQQLEVAMKRLGIPTTMMKEGK